MNTRSVFVAAALILSPSARGQTVGTPALGPSPARDAPTYATGAPSAAQPLANGAPSALPNALPGAATPSAPSPGSATANDTAPVGNAASNQVTNH